MRKLRFLITAVAFFVMSGSAYAQATRTWVSGVGDDANPCSRTAPCKTFAGAISKTAAQGIINVLDPGGFGAVTITKSITIDATPFMAGVLASGTNGIIISAAATDNVILRGLDIEGANTGLRGIRVLTAGSVVIDRCRIERFTQRGVSVETSAAVNVTISNSLITHAVDGISFTPSAGSPSVKATISNCVINHNTSNGITANNGAQVTVNDSTIGLNNVGVLSNSTTTFTIVNLVRTVVAHNFTGLRTTGGANAFISISDVALQENTTAGFSIVAGQINSYENNQANGNGANVGALTPTPKV